MSDRTFSLSRRSAFVGAGALAATGLAVSQAQAAEMTATEKANLNVVTDFLAIWAKQETDPATGVSFFTDDCVVRMEEDKPALVGKTPLAGAFAGLLKSGRYKIDVLNSLSRGPVVTVDRVDASITDPSKKFVVVGVFVLKDGKIKEWMDYMVKA